VVDGRAIRANSLVRIRYPSTPVVPAGRPAVPTKVEWLASEYLKTRVATGYCSRHLAAEACPYANACGTQSSSFAQAA